MPSERSPLPPPPPAQRRPVRETLFGRDVVDPYRYLEDGDDPATRAFVAAQNAYTRSLLDAVDGRGALAAALGRVLGTGALGAPVRRGERLFYSRRRPDADQPALYVCDLDGASERLLYDPAAEDDAGLVSLDWWYPSPDGALVAYGTARGGDEWSTLRVRDVATGEDLPDRVERARSASVAWEPDGTAFFYTRYPLAGEVAVGQEYYHRHVFHHRLGATGVDADAAVFGAGRPGEEIPSVHLSPDGRHLLIEASRGWAQSDLWWCDRRRGGGTFTPLFANEAATFAPIVGGDRLYVLTNLGAPNFRLLAADYAALERGREAFVEFVAEDADAVLLAAAVAADGVVAVYGRDAVAELRLFALDGRPRRVDALAPLASVLALEAAPDASGAHLLVQSFTEPGWVLHLDTATGALTTWRRLEPPADVAGICVRQVVYRSKDGTRVPMFILTGPDLPGDGPPPRPAPTVLEGYGGFRISRSPEYLPRLVPWLRRGGVYAIANLRGGSEYGERWHRDGMLDRKQNVFDDFIAAAEHLVAEGYTTPDRLGVYGASNGGLLVGSLVTQRPDLARAALCGVPLLDMLRYHRFRLGGLWTAEYGSPDDAVAFEWLYAYSPYHHVRAGERYPAMLITTAANDSRVDPMHALKMAARLQAASTTLSERPILLKVERDAGHGAGKPVAKAIDHLVDVWSFLAWQLDPEGRWR